MADKRVGEDRVVFQPENKSREAPQIHQLGSSAQGAPGTSSNVRGDLPDAHKKRKEGSAPRNFARSTPIAVGAALAAAALVYCLGRFFCQNQRGPHSDAPNSGEEGSASNIDDEASEEGSATERPRDRWKFSSVNECPPGDSGLIQGGNLVGLHGHEKQLSKSLLADVSRKEDVSARKGSITLSDLYSPELSEVVMNVESDVVVTIGSDSNTDGKALEEGSDSDIHGKASEEGSAPERELNPVTKTPPGNSGLIQGGVLVGLHGHKERLIKLLLKDNSGTTDVLVRGELGMTALVRKVCEDDRVRDGFATVAWISAPQLNEFGMIREEILLQLLFKNAPSPDDFGSDNREVKYFTNSLECSKARCLIVIDNLVDPRTQKTLNSRFFETNKETYKVIFMARRNSPINTYGRQCVIYELENLFVEEPWAHFCSGDFSSPLKEVCKLVHREFGSLPGTIVFYLRKGKERNDEWAPIILPSFNLFQQVLEILSSDERLFCLSYLSIFPENSEISCKRIYRLWAAEGLLPNLGEAEGFFKDLLIRKCIHPAEKRSDGEVSTFRVDNLVREIIGSFSHHCNLGKITRQGHTNWPESVRCLFVQGTMKGLKEKKSFQLSSTFVPDVSSSEDKTISSEASPVETFEISSFQSKLKHSKVLDLKGAPFQNVSDGLFELADLRYWSIRNTSIKVIPDSIGNLTRLEFLDAKHSLVTELPKEAEGLERIRHILIYHYEKDPLTESYNLNGFKASCRVKGFLDLEKLCFVEADERTLKDLGNLTKLRRLGITKLRKEHGEELCTSLKELKELKSLNIHAFDEDEIIDLNGLSSPSKYLKHFYLHGRLEELPDWISSCKCLTKIILRWSHLDEDLLPTLGKLPELVELELRRAYDGKQLNFMEKQFPKLKILLLEELEGLRSMSLEKKTMPCLEDLTISRCQWLEIIPSGIEDISTIQKLTFFDMSHEFYEKVRADHENDGYKKFERIPEVYFTRWRAGHWEIHQVESTDEAHCSHQVESTDEAPCSHQVEITDEAPCSHQVEITDEAHRVKSTDEAPCSHQVERTDEAHQEMEKSLVYDYEVFLSFRGPDTRTGITDYLYTSMIDAGIRVYKDDEELRIGEEIGVELLQTIEQSKILIPIFSKGYADSAWCLMELAKMVESKNTRKQKIMPIFYDVAPSEVRQQTEHYNNALVSHANKKRFGDETINKWKAALNEVGALKGWNLHCMPNRGKGEFVKEVVNNVSAELKTAYLEVCGCLVEVDNHVDEIMRMIGAGNDETKIVGIHGAGGIGKTTLAKIVYNQLSCDFDNCCFLSNIRETKITHLQNHLISTILRRQWLDINDIMEGKKVIERRLCSKKVLLLLDDVDHASQLDALMQKREWFGKGSKIIITTRNPEIFQGPTVIETYELIGLDFNHSIQLFSKHAFRRDYPLEQYIHWSERAVIICRGLPLALEALGSLLSGKTVEEWAYTLKELEQFPPYDVLRKLLISIEALNEDQGKDDGRNFTQQGSVIKPENQQ